MESLKTIIYFSIFRYPLKLEEIHGYNSFSFIEETEVELKTLLDKNIVIKINDFYVYSNDIESVNKRKNGNFNAKKILQKAQKIALFISKFPYVKSVGVSGSLSKGYYDNDSDIDYFIICEPNRLWICRTLLMLFKKIFLLNSRKYFCINYFISLNQLEIEEKNRFTATELKTLIPMQGKSDFEKFFQENKWVNTFFKKHKINLIDVPEISKPILIKFLEWILNSKLGDTMDDIFKNITLKKWNSKFDYMNNEDFKTALKSTKNISKHHPTNFQKKVIDALNSKYELVKENYQIEIPKEHV